MNETVKQKQKQNHKQKHKKHIALKVIGIILLIIILFGASVNFYKSNPKNLQTYKTTNAYILDTADVAAHRSGGGLAPEETMMAFKNCAESTDFKVNVFEFDLHLTKDNVLVLLHDETLDRSSDSEKVFGKEGVLPADKTYDELRQLNMGAKFENEDKEMPYKDYSGDSVPDDLRILRLEDALDYLINQGNNTYKYIIEIKDAGDTGKKGVDLLHKVMVEKNIVDKVIFGTFHKEVSEYVDEKYPDMTRSTSPKEVAEFWKAALSDDKNYEPPCEVLQLPYRAPFEHFPINVGLGTTDVVNYAHKHNMAIQYWTVNRESDIEYLLSIGADCIMTDYPDKLYDIEQKNA